MVAPLYYCRVRCIHEGRISVTMSSRSHPRGDDRSPGKGSPIVSAATSPALVQRITPTRKVPRYKLTVPLRLTVLRSGVPGDIPGRTLEIGEGGVGVTVASQLLLGESVRVEFLLPHMTTPVRATAVVRYQRESCFGLQFLRLPVEQQSIIRYWTRREADIQLAWHDPSTRTLPDPAIETTVEPLAGTLAGQTPTRMFRIPSTVSMLLAAVVIACIFGWWRWEQGWTDLEARIPAQAAETVSPQLQVPAEEMRRHLLHEVRPDYPESARQASEQGRVVIDAIVSSTGVVTQTKVVSGMPVLANAAINAVRWWRYQPYLVNGQSVPVETTITVDFRLNN
jgi:TonB family protein